MLTCAALRYSNGNSQHPDTHLPIRISAVTLSATLYIRSLDISLSETSQLVRTRSRLAYTYFPIAQASTTRNWTMRQPKRTFGFSLFILVIIYLFGRIGTVLEQLTEKPLHFCKGFFSLFSVWWSLRDSNPLPPACKFYARSLTPALLAQSIPRISTASLLIIPSISFSGTEGR